jgi:hypothetical protein
VKPKAQVALLSPLSVEQCILSLNRAIGPEDWFDSGSAPMPGWKNMVGKIEGNSFRLHRRKYTLWYREYTVPAFWGSVVSQAGGTRIEGYFHLAPYGQVLRGAWLALAAAMFVLLTIPTLVDVIGGRKLGNDGAWEIVFPPIAVLWGIVFPHWVLWWHNEDRPIIQDFLCNTLSATIEVPRKAL